MTATAKARRNCSKEAKKSLKFARKYAKHGKSMTKKQKKTFLNSYTAQCVKTYGKTLKKIKGHWKMV